MWKNFDIVKFQADLFISELSAASTPNPDIDLTVETQDSIMTWLLDVHAPMSEVTCNKATKQSCNFCNIAQKVTVDDQKLK